MARIETSLDIFKEYKKEISDTRCRSGQYWTNIVASLLKQADAEIGRAEGNRLIRECNLEKHGWTQEAETAQ